MANVARIALSPIRRPQVEQNTEAEAVSDQHVDIIDAYVDDLGYIHKRPCLELFTTLGTGLKIDGLYWWQEQDRLIAVSGGEVFSIDKVGTATSLGTGLQTNTRAIFAEANPSDTNTLLIANGQNLFKTTGGSISQITDPSLPANISHVVFLNQYLLVNNTNTARIQFSNVNSVDNWDAVDVFTAEAKQDVVTGIFEAQQDIMIVGTDSIEFYYDTGSGFEKRIGARIQSGSLSPYSFKFVDNTWFYLDNTRRVIRLNGRTPQVISAPIDKTIQRLDIVEDATGDVIEIDGQAFYVLSFPSEDRTFVYSYRNDYWTEWRQWIHGTATSKRFLGNVHAYSNNWNYHLVGDKNNGNIYRLRTDIFQDNGNEVKTEIITGYIDHGTMRNKQSQLIRFRMRRGKSIVSGTPKLLFSYRNSGDSQWRTEREIDAGATGDVEIFRKITSLGKYRARQYKLVMTDNAELLIGSAEEEFEVMSR